MYVYIHPSSLHAHWCKDALASVTAERDYNTHTCIYMCVYIYICMYLCMYVCMYVYICVCVYIYTYIQPSSLYADRCKDALASVSAERDYMASLCDEGNAAMQALEHEIIM